MSASLEMMFLLLSWQFWDRRSIRWLLARSFL